jgi:hypothetical protein
MMGERGMDGLITACVAIAMLLSVVSFVKVLLSVTLAVFVAGLGIGALTVLAVIRSASRKPT